MPSEVSDGGPAFPVPMIPIDNTGGHTEVRYEGMMLRDWFAGRWISGSSTIMTEDYVDEAHAKMLAQEAYRVADAMLAERLE